jgi:hypothetical protein
MNAYLRQQQSIKFTTTIQIVGKTHSHSIAVVGLLITERKLIVEVVE